MTDMNYKNEVKKLAKQRDGQPIYNGSVEHAAVIVENMFAHAHDRMSILTGKLQARVFGREEVREQAALFLADPRNKLQILIEEDVALTFEHPFLEQFWRDSNVEVRHVPPDQQEAYNYHFLVMDGDSYRFEKDKDEPTAVAAFGDAEAAHNLEDIFEYLWENAIPKPAPEEALTA